MLDQQLSMICGGLGEQRGQESFPRFTAVGDDSEAVNIGVQQRPYGTMNLSARQYNIMTDSYLYEQRPYGGSAGGFPGHFQGLVAPRPSGILLYYRSSFGKAPIDQTRLFVYCRTRRKNAAALFFIGDVKRNNRFLVYFWGSGGK